MNSNEFDKILKHTLADFRLSRGEKRVLGNILKECDPDQQQLAFLRHRAFEIARGELAGPEASKVVDWLEKVVKVLQPEPVDASPPAAAYFSPGDNCVQKIVNLLGRVRRKVDICVFTITDDRITESIVNAHQRRAAIRIITDNDKAEDRGSDIDELERAGIPVRVDRTDYHMHHKFAVFDDAVTLTGSYNWTRSAARYNEENFIITSDARLTRAFSAAFEQLWNGLA